MKARLFRNIGFGLALSAMPFVGACDQVSNAPHSLVTAAQAEPAPATASNVVVSANTVAGSVPPDSAFVPAPPPGAGKSPLPPNIKPSSPVAEVAKLAQSGVDESVMLTYVNNSGSMFNLGSDEIIYLNDIGVPNSVVTAMIQRDQSLKQAWAQTAPAPVLPDAQTAQAAAPSYVEAPQPEPVTEPVATQPANVTYNYFYDSLSPYGTWIDIDGYGRCWQPTVVLINSGWRPYCDRGRWLYTDAGWYWHSDYSWGSLAFHYGRWFHHTRWGWCWYPDYVWGPSWVTWRYSGDYCGWAPLPPAAYYRPGFGFYYHNRSVGFGFDFGIGAAWFNFVSWRNFCDSRPWHHRVYGDRVTQIYQNTTIVNNIITGDNNTIINRGVPVDQARRHAGREIRQVAIRETPTAAGFNGRGERLERDGRTLLVHRPNIPASASEAAPPARVTRDTRPSRTPTAGAGAAAQLETSSGRPARIAADARERSIRPVSDKSPLNTSPRVEADRGKLPSPPATSGTTRPGSSTPRGRTEPSTVPAGGRNRDGNRSSTASSLIVRGNDPVPAMQAVPMTQPRTSLNDQSSQRTRPNLIVVGRRNSDPTPVGSSGFEARQPSARVDISARPTHNWTSSEKTATRSAATPQAQPPRMSAPTPSTSLSYNNSPSPPRSTVTRQYTTSPRTYGAPAPPSRSAQPQSAAPAYSAARSSPSPSFSAPRSATSSSPSYSAPRSSPSTTFSAPRSSTPSPSPSYSAPRSSPSPAPAPSYSPAPSRGSSTPSFSGRSDSGRRGSSRRD